MRGIKQSGSRSVQIAKYGQAMCNIGCAEDTQTWGIMGSTEQFLCNSRVLFLPFFFSVERQTS